VLRNLKTEDNEVAAKYVGLKDISDFSYKKYPGAV
jgi:hypothetical protein